MWDWQFTLEILPKLLQAFGTTIQATLLGTVLALVLGLVWAILRRSGNWVIASAVGAIVEFIRSTPLLVQLYFFFFVMPEVGLAFSPLTTGILALGLHYSTYASEVYRAGIDGVPKGQWEAAIALSMSPWQMWRIVILPQAIPPILPALGNYAIAMSKDTPLLATITVMELLQVAKLIGARTFRYLEPLTLVGLLFLIISLLSSQVIRKLEERFANH